MPLVRHHKDSPYIREKCRIQTKLIRKKWRQEKNAYRQKRRLKHYTHIPPPTTEGQEGAGMVPPSPQDMSAIVEYVKRNQLGGSVKHMEVGTLVPHNEIIKCHGKPTVFNHPTQIIITGPTKAGKTTLAIQILSNRDVMLPGLQEIYWFYTMESSTTKAREHLPGVNFVQGFPTLEKLESLDTTIPKLIVLDDMQEMTDKKATFEDLKKLFTAVSHHCNISLIFIVQDIYVNKNMTRLANQAENLLAMCNGAACYQIPKLGNKLFGSGHEHFIRWAISDVKANSSHGYLLLSTGAEVLDCYKVRSKILPQDYNTFYIKKGTPKTEAYQSLKEDASQKFQNQEDGQHQNGHVEAPQQRWPEA